MYQQSNFGEQREIAPRTLPWSTTGLELGILVAQYFPATVNNASKCLSQWHDSTTIQWIERATSQSLPP